MLSTNFRIFQILLLVCLLSACADLTDRPPTEATNSPVSTRSSQPAILERTDRPTRTPEPAETIYPTIPAPTPSPTFLIAPTIESDALIPTPLSSLPSGATNPLAIILQQSHCRYGPGTAYLHSHDLYTGDRGQVDGRNASGNWLWIKPTDIDRHCWVAASVVQVSGDVKDVPVVESKLPYSDLYGPPQNVQAVRDGNTVTIIWDLLPFTVDDDRGYMLQLTTCQGGQSVSESVHTNTNSYTVNDETGCDRASGGTLWGVEKHGYTQSVEIPWP